jgi:hypothetical protein
LAIYGPHSDPTDMAAHAADNIAAIAICIRRPPEPRT